MNDMTNKLMLQVTDPDLQEYLSQKSPGDTCVFEVAVSVDELTDTQAVFTVDEVNFDEDSDMKDESGEEDDKPKKPKYGDGEGIPPVMLVFGNNA